MRSLGVFIGSSHGVRSEYTAAAQAFGALLARRHITLIYGGGKVGLMGVLADAVLAGGGRVVGVIPQLLLDKEVGHGGLSELHVVTTMTERKVLMGELAEAFVALPGGIGTLDELFEVWTWTQLGLQDKHCGLLNVLGYFDPLVAFIDRCVDEGFLAPRARAVLHVQADAAVLLQELAEAR